MNKLQQPQQPQQPQPEMDFSQSIFHNIELMTDIYIFVSAVRARAREKNGRKE